jgi:hypothetical protein
MERWLALGVTVLLFVGTAYVIWKLILKTGGG